MPSFKFFVFKMRLLHGVIYPLTFYLCLWYNVTGSAVYVFKQHTKNVALMSYQAA